MNIRTISPQDTYNIRKLYFHDFQYSGDDEDQTLHLGSFKDNKLVGIASFFYRHNPKLEGEHHYQVRGIASAPHFHGQKCGTTLIRTAIPLIKKNQGNKLWAVANNDNCQFYEKMGFDYVDENLGKDDILMVLELDKH